MANAPYATTINDDQPGGSLFTIPIFAMSAVAAADELTDFVPGFPFEIIGLDFVAVTPITTAGKAATFKPTIDGAAVPGCALTVSGTKAKGVVTAGTAPTSRVTGTSTSKVKVTASSVTAFVEGTGYLVLKLRALGGNPS